MTDWPEDPSRPRSALDPRDERYRSHGPCCRVRQTLQIGPSEQATEDAYKVLWESKTPLEMNRADCGDGPGVGLLSLNFISFVSSSGDFTGPTRSIEIFLIRQGREADDRVDVVSIPLIKRTVALGFVQYPGGFPVPLDPAGGARFWLRTRVTADNNGTKWCILAGLMLARQNAF